MGSCVHVFCKTSAASVSLFSTTSLISTQTDFQAMSQIPEVWVWITKPPCAPAVCAGAQVESLWRRTAVWRSELSKPPFLPVLWTRLGFHLTTQHHVSSPARVHAPSGLHSHTENHMGVWAAAAQTAEVLFWTSFHHCTCRKFMVTSVASWKAEAFLRFLKRK